MKILKKIFSIKKKENFEKGVEKTRENLLGKIGKIILGKSTIDENILDDLEDVLISSDVGVNTTIKIIKNLEKRIAREKYINTRELHSSLKKEIKSLLINKENNTRNFEIPAGIHPFVILVVGVNGVGKTTTIGKLGAQFKQQGKRVILGAADTFRAAAVNQLKSWGDRIDVPVVSHGMNIDPASVAYDTVKQGLSKNADIIIIDTAGRLHTKINLMNELAKIRRVIEKAFPQAPHEVLLVLDASTGQNALIQAREFTKSIQVNALAITKLDGTAKGGVVLSISDELKIPIKYIGIGEKIEDLQIFDKEIFVDSLLGNEFQ